MIKIPPVQRTYRFDKISEQVEAFLADENRDHTRIGLKGYEEFIDHIHDWLKKELENVCNVQTYQTLHVSGKVSYTTHLTKWDSYAAVRVTLETDETHPLRDMRAFLKSPERRGPYYVYPGELSAEYDCYDDTYDELLMWVCEHYDAHRDQGVIGNYKLEVFVPSRHDSFVLEQGDATPVFT